MKNSSNDSDFQQEPQQKKRFRLDMSWKGNKEALVAAIKWIIFLLIINAVRVLIFR